MSPPRLSTRHALAILLGLILVLAGYGAYWFHAAGMVRDSIAGWARDKRSQGWQVDYAHLEINGFPTRIAVIFTAPAIRTPGGLGWRGDTLSGRASLVNPRLLHLTALGRQDVTMEGQTIGEILGGMRGDLTFGSDGRLTEAHLNAADARTEAPKAHIDAMAFSFVPVIPAANDRAPTLRFVATATGITLAAAPLPGFDQRIALAEIDGRLLGGFPPGPPLDALRQWSANGGSLSVDHLALEWAPMALEAEGTFAFDRDMQPQAAFSANVRGYNVLMARLSQAGVMAPGAANAATMILSMLARPDAQGRPAVSVPVTLQRGNLSLGPALIATFPPISWPAPEGGSTR